tara:strand:+ start:482 stop:799 length:318 start_codon:yes stop_codon:yes gene_type:complete
MPLKLRKSKREGKKWVAKDEKRTIHFGQENARDFTLISKPSSKFYLADPKEREKVKKAYRARHAKDNLDNPFSPGALSYYILWSQPTMKGGIREYEKRFNIKVEI